MSTSTITISCDDCAMQRTVACHDCVVTYLCDRAPGAVVIDVSEIRAVRMLSTAGLVPQLRHRRRPA